MPAISIYGTTFLWAPAESVCKALNHLFDRMEDIQRQLDKLKELSQKCSVFLDEDSLHATTVSPMLPHSIPFNKAGMHFKGQAASSGPLSPYHQDLSRGSATVLGL